MNNFSIHSRDLMRKLITTTILSLIFFTTTVFGQSYSTYKVIIDNCHSSIINEGTNNTITVDFLNGNRIVKRTSKKSIKECSSNAKFSIQSNENITGVNITTTGDDGLYIDKIELYKGGVLVKRHGADNGKGWCLSTDPGDAHTAWKGTTENGCKTSQYFEYPSSGTSQTTGQTTGTEYKVVIDNCHSSISYEGTNNTITVEFLNGNSIVKRTSKKGIKECSSNAIFSIHSNQNITGVNVRTTGDDGFYIDKIELYKGGELVKRYGTDNGKGWCVSTDPGDAHTVWKGTTENGCKTSQFFGYPSSGSTQTTGQTSGTEYKVVIDNCHSSISYEGTNNTITVEFLNGNSIVKRISKKSIKECSSNAIFSIHSNQNITRVNITTTGDDGFYIDKIELYKGGELVKRYGTDNGKGWCLSTDPGDAHTAWRGTTENGCNTSVIFKYK